jgi:hypothetical protein
MSMLLAEDKAMLRELLPHLWGVIALHDSEISAEMDKALRASPFFWESTDEGYYFHSTKAMILAYRALAEVAQEEVGDADTLRSWLPSPDELLHLFEHEFM